MRACIVVEGPDDQNFVNGVLLPRIAAHENQGFLGVIPWATWSNRKRKDFIRPLLARNIPVVILVDLDVGCVSRRKEMIVERHPYVAIGSVYVAEVTIEAWYLAGAPANILRTLRRKRSDPTDNIDKDRFEQLILGSGNDIALTKAEILDSYEFDAARQRNRSLNYVFKKLQGSVLSGGVRE